MGVCSLLDADDDEDDDDDDDEDDADVGAVKDGPACAKNLVEPLSWFERRSKDREDSLPIFVFCSASLLYGLTWCRGQLEEMQTDPLSAGFDIF